MKKRFALIMVFAVLLTGLTACSTESKLIGTWEAYNQELTLYEENRFENNGDYGTWQLLGDDVLELDFGFLGIVEHYTVVKVTSQELTLSSDEELPLTAEEDDLEVTYRKTK